LSRLLALSNTKAASHKLSRGHVHRHLINNFVRFQ